jgi:hypothetical protein
MVHDRAAALADAVRDNSYICMRYDPRGCPSPGS